jgi:hypothetical protein
LKRTCEEAFCVGFDGEVFYWEKYNYCETLFSTKYELVGVGISVNFSSLGGSYYLMRGQHFLQYRQFAIIHKIYNRCDLKPIFIPCSKSVFAKVNEIRQKVAEGSIASQIKNELMKRKKRS